MNLAKAVRAVGLVAGLTLVTNVLGFVRELLMARAFGTGPAADAFVTAFAIVSTCFLVFTAGTVQAAFMPAYQRLVAAGVAAQARGLFWRAMFWLGGLLAAGTVVLVLAAAPVVAVVVPGFDAARAGLTVELTRILAPLVALAGSAVLLQSVLHAQQRFIAPAVVPALNNLLVIGVLAAFGASAAIFPVAWAYVAGGLLWWVILGPATRPFLAGGADFANRQAFRAALAALGPLILLLVVDQTSALVQKRFVSDLELGSIAALNYAYKLEGLPVGIFAAAVATVFFPSLIDAIVRGNRHATSAAFRDGVTAIVHVAVPATLLLGLKSELVVRVLFERGAFDARATELTAAALRLYALGLVPQSLIVFLNRVFYAAGDTVTPMRIGIAAAALHVGLAWWAVSLIGYTGVALATTVYAFIYAGWLGLRLRQVSGVGLAELMRSGWRAAGAGAGSGAALLAFPGDGGWAALAGAAFLVVAAYGALLWTLRDPLLLRLAAAGRSGSETGR